MPTLDEQSIFLAAQLITGKAERQAYLAQACAGDAALRSRIESLLRVLDYDPQFLQTPAVVGSAPLVADLSGNNIGPYQLIGVIGEGGMGTVYVAEQSHPVKRRVALKVIKPGMDSRQVIARFEAERQALALMVHPNIAGVLDAGAGPDGRPYFVMDLVEGVPITRYCDEHHLTPRQRLELFIPVCHAVQHAHQKGIIHRDLKPSNVLVTQFDGQPIPKIIDFGVAKAVGTRPTAQTLDTALGSIVGTLEYMSPEQAEPQHADIDTRSDIYSLGVLLYELLTGSTPLQRKHLKEGAFLEMLRIIREEEPPKPSTRLSTADELPAIAARRGLEPRRLSGQVRGDLDWIAMKCLEKDRTRRYETANGLARDIQRYLGEEPIEARPPSAAYRWRKFADRHRAGLTIATAFLLLLGGAAVGGTWLAVRAMSAERTANEQRDHAVVERVRADEQTAVANAVNEFLQDGLLGQADIANQPAGIARNKDITVRELLDRAARNIDGKFPGQEQTEAQIRTTLATAYDRLGEFQIALVHFQHRQLLTAKLGADHADTLKCLNNLAVLCVSRGRLEEARTLFEEVLERRRRTLPPGSQWTLSAMQSLGVTYRELGRLDDAERVFRQAMELSQIYPLVSKEEALLATNNLATLYLSRGRFADAEPLLKEVVQGFNALQGPDHPLTASGTSNLASCYMELRRFGEAEPLFRQLVATRRSTLGPDNPKTLFSVNLWALSLKALGRLEEAETLLREMLQARRIKLGNDHVDTLTSASNLGSLLMERKQYEEAEPLLKEALAGRRLHLKDDHPDTFRSLNSLAVLFRDTGRLSAAEPLFLEAATGAKSKLGPGHPQTRIYISNLADTYARQSNLAAAEAWRKQIPGDGSK